MTIALATAFFYAAAAMVLIRRRGLDFVALAVEDGVVMRAFGRRCDAFA